MITYNNTDALFNLMPTLNSNDELSKILEKFSSFICHSALKHFVQNMTFCISATGMDLPGMVM